MCVCVLFQDYAKPDGQTADIVAVNVEGSLLEPAEEPKAVEPETAEAPQAAEPETAEAPQTDDSEADDEVVQLAPSFLWTVQYEMIHWQLNRLSDQLVQIRDRVADGTRASHFTELRQEQQLQQKQRQ